MGRVIIGAAAGAVAMFIIGYIFFLSPLAGIAAGSLEDAQAAEVQAALAANITSAGAYEIPVDGSQAQKVMYAQGPIAFVQYNINGGGSATSADMLARLVHMYISALLIGFALLAISYHIREFGVRARIVILFALGAGVLIHFGQPVREHFAFGYYIYVFIADALSLIAAGLIIARWFLPRDWDGGERIGAEAD